METLLLLQKAISQGIILIVAAISAGIGAFLGAYLKKKGEDTAIRENFTEILKQLKEKTDVIESIRDKFATHQTQDIFLRDLYVSGIKEYSSEQAYALRQAYILLYEPRSSGLESSGEGIEKRLETAIRLVMEPLRKHIGLLDESTIKKIYDVQHKLIELKFKVPEEMKKSKND